MKLNKNYIQTFVFILVYLFAIYFWSQPYQERKLPYGEYDAIAHFTIGDYMASKDKSMTYLPSYIAVRSGWHNKFKENALWHYPTFHTNLAIMQVIGGERVVPIYLINTIMATFVIVTVYFVVNSLFGFLPAILSSILIIFSPRDFMSYIWGQWPERFGYAFTPIILYCFYKYFISYSKENNKPIYLYLTALFLGANNLIHTLTFLHSVSALIVLYLLLLIKQKKLAFNWKHISVSIFIVLLLAFIFPYQTFNNIFFETKEPEDAAQAQNEKKIDISRLFQWSMDPKDFAGSVPPFYFSFKEMNGLWTIPFLLLGLSFLVLRREKRDLFLLAWLISLYLILHRDFLGNTKLLHRSLSASAHIFAPLTAIGAIYLGSLVKLPSNYNKYIKYGMAFVFIYLAISINAKIAFAMLNKNIYNPNTNDGFFTTLNQAEYDVGDWEMKNLDPNYNVTVLGILHQSEVLSATAHKLRWLEGIAQHPHRFYFLVEDKEEASKLLRNNYVLLDYTMVGPVGDKQTLDKMQEIERTELINRTLLYNQNYIRVYKFETKKQ